MVESLIDAGLDELRSRGAFAVLVWSPRHHPYRRLFTRRGFFVGRDGADLAYRLWDATPEDVPVLQDPRGAVHLMQGDGDWV